jgi:hypothetical protein
MKSLGMKKATIVLLTVFCFGVFFLIARAIDGVRKVALPTSTTLSLPVPGFVGRTNSYPAAIVVSPDGRYAAFLNQGYGTQESGVRQSIAILDLNDNRMSDFPDDRLRGDEKTTQQSYFIGLEFSTDGKHLYASMSTSFRAARSPQNDSSPFPHSAWRRAKPSFLIAATPCPALHHRIPPDLWS